jgi:hypothetical protein
VKTIMDEILLGIADRTMARLAAAGRSKLVVTRSTLAVMTILGFAGAALSPDSTVLALCAVTGLAALWFLVGDLRTARSAEPRTDRQFVEQTDHALKLRRNGRPIRVVAIMLTGLLFFLACVTIYSAVFTEDAEAVALLPLTVVVYLQAAGTTVLYYLSATPPQRMAPTR